MTGSTIPPNIPPRPPPAPTGAPEPESSDAAGASPAPATAAPTAKPVPTPGDDGRSTFASPGDERPVHIDLSGRRTRRTGRDQGPVGDVSAFTGRIVEFASAHGPRVPFHDLVDASADFWPNLRGALAEITADPSMPSLAQALLKLRYPNGDALMQSLATTRYRSSERADDSSLHRTTKLRRDDTIALQAAFPSDAVGSIRRLFDEIGAVDSSGMVAGFSPLQGLQAAAQWPIGLGQFSGLLLTARDALALRSGRWPYEGTAWKGTPPMEEVGAAILNQLAGLAHKNELSLDRSVQPHCARRQTEGVMRLQPDRIAAVVAALNGNGTFGDQPVRRRMWLSLVMADHKIKSPDRTGHQHVEIEPRLARQAETVALRPNSRHLSATLRGGILSHIASGPWDLESAIVDASRRLGVGDRISRLEDVLAVSARGGATPASESDLTLWELVDRIAHRMSNRGNTDRWFQFRFRPETLASTLVLAAHHLGRPLNHLDVQKLLCGAEGGIQLREREEMVSLLDTLQAGATDNHRAVHEWLTTGLQGGNPSRHLNAPAPDVVLQHVAATAAVAMQQSARVQEQLLGWLDDNLQQWANNPFPGGAIQLHAQDVPRRFRYDALEQCLPHCLNAARGEVDLHRLNELMAGTEELPRQEKAVIP